MPLIKLKYKDEVQQLFPISIGQTLTIGRSDSNDIVIDNVAVSGVHARIDSLSSTFMITDLKSKNGTFVNRELISGHDLKNNDVILIGKHELIFDQSDLDLEASTQDEKTRFIDTTEYNKDIDDEKTRHLDTTEYRELINKAKGQAAGTSRGTSAQVSQDEGGNFFSRLLKKIFG